MLSIYDSASMAQAMTLDLDPQLRALLKRRFASLKTIYGDLSDSTEWFVIQPGDVESHIVDELGYSPLVEPLDGARFGTREFRPYWDHLVRHDAGYFEMSVSYGSTFASVLIVQDADGVLPALRAMCRRYAA